MIRMGMALLALGLSFSLAAGQTAAPKDVEWPEYAADLQATKYSPLDQIDAENLKDLRVAWRWKMPDLDLPNADRLAIGSFKATPIMVNGVLYTSTSLSQVAAINPKTGETVWLYDPKSYERGRTANAGNQHRGVAYWTDGKEERIVIATGTRQLIALDAKTGKPFPDFGTNGAVELAEGLGKKINERALGYSAPPIIVGDTIVLGSIVSDGATQREMPPGHVRGFDVRTGKQKWMFHTIPQAGESGVETWEEDSWTYSGNTNVWTMMSADPELGYVYLPVSTPTNDFYGGHRKGDNLYAESLVCLNADTGERVWHYQLIHHGLWDYDPPCAPNLIDIEVEGKKVKAVAQVTKQGFTYVFDRVTGEPVWPIEERPVPQSDVPGEKTSPTQPFPTKPPAFERQGIGEADLIDFTPELKEQALEIFEQYRSGPLYTPPTVIKEDGTQGTIILPGLQGGAVWGGAAVDPETGRLYVPSTAYPFTIGLTQPDPNRSDLAYRLGGTMAAPKIGEEGEGDSFFGKIDGLQIIKPPYGQLTAIDMNEGDFDWQRTLGDGPLNHPLLKDLKLEPMGTPNMNASISSGGPMLTKSLLFVSQSIAGMKYEPGYEKGVSGYLHAFDKETGEQVGRFEFQLAPHGVPMTYSIDGKQYIVVATGGGAVVPGAGQQGAELVALALP